MQLAELLMWRAGDQHGPGPREDVLLALPDAVRDQASSSSRHYPQVRTFLNHIEAMTHCLLIRS